MVPCIFPSNQGIDHRDGFAPDCLLQRRVERTSISCPQPIARPSFKKALSTDHWPFEADGRLERPAARSPPWLYQLGTVRGEPKADLGECPYAAPDRSQVGPRRPSLADRIGALRPLRPHDAGVLWHAIGPCSPLPLPRRRQSRRGMAMHRYWRCPDRSRRRRADRRRRFGARDRSRNPGRRSIDKGR